MSDTLSLACALIQKPSISPEDGGCQALLMHILNHLGFTIHELPFGDTRNFFAQYGTGPLFLFAGHTDVVPPGPLKDWETPPFEPTLRDHHLYGRGAADMKSSLAAMIVACCRLLEQPLPELHSEKRPTFLAAPPLKGSIGFLITSDEEDKAIDGTAKVVEWMLKKQILPRWCLVGEPSSSTRLGDQIRIGRRGSLNGLLTFYGKQGHVAYPEKAENPIHGALEALTALRDYPWDQGNAHFPPTRLQISAIESSTQASNVIPGHVTVRFNFRFSPEVTSATLQDSVEALLQRQKVHYQLQWHLSGEPFLSPSGELIQACNTVIYRLTQQYPVLSTGGGTSDGRFIAKTGCEIVELGPVNATIHQVNERIACEELEQLTHLYHQLLCEILLTS